MRNKSNLHQVVVKENTTYIVDSKQGVQVASA